jgi:hypothetical protein
MNKIILSSLLFFLIVPTSFAHSGRTDKNGGHNCSQASIDKRTLYWLSLSQWDCKN